MRARNTVTLATLAFATVASAAVVQVSQAGFLVRHEATFAAPPAEVYEAIV